MTAELALSNIEAILSDVERLERETEGIYRQASDFEAYDVVCRIERKMREGNARSHGGEA